MAKLLSEKYGRPKYGISNLSHKLIKGSLRYEDALDIAEVLGYDIQWVKKKRKPIAETHLNIGARYFAVYEFLDFKI